MIRTPPGRGNVTVNWKIFGQNLELNFANFTGQLFFPEVRPPRRALPNICRENSAFWENWENSDYVMQRLMEASGRATCLEPQRKNITWIKNFRDLRNRFVFPYVLGRSPSKKQKMSTLFLSQALLPLSGPPIAVYCVIRKKSIVSSLFLLLPALELHMHGNSKHSSKNECLFMSCWQRIAGGLH